MLIVNAEKAMAPHSSTLAWRIPWTEEPGRLQSLGSLGVRHDGVTSLTFHFRALEKEMATHSSTLAWRIPGMGEPGGLPSMGSHRVWHNWSDSSSSSDSEWWSKGRDMDTGICTSWGRDQRKYYPSVMLLTMPNENKGNVTIWKYL